MAKARGNNPDPPMKRKIRPSQDPAVRESQLIALAIDRVEQRIIDGTATSQELVHFLRLGTQEKQLEMEKLRHENELLKEKTSAIKAQKESAVMFAEAIAAMQSYRPPMDEEEDDDF